LDTSQSYALPHTATAGTRIECGYYAHLGCTITMVSTISTHFTARR